MDFIYIQQDQRMMKCNEKLIGKNYAPKPARVINHLFLILACVFITESIYAQSRELDSLFNIVSTSKVQIDVADAHGAISWIIMDSDMEAAEAHLDTAKILYEKENDSYGISRCAYQAGVINRKKGLFEKALIHFDRYMAYVDTLLDRNRASGMSYYCGFQYAVIYEEQGDYERSLKTLFSLLEQDDWEAGVDDKSNLHNSIGIVYKSLGNYDESKKHYKLALDYIEDSEFKEDIANVYSNLSDVLAVEKSFEEAKEYTFKSIDLFKMLNNSYGMAMGYFDIGNIFFKQDKLFDAERYMLMANETFEKNDRKEKKMVYVGLGELYMKKLLFKDAEKYYKKAIKLDMRVSDDMNAHEGLSKLYKYKGDHERALIHFEKYHYLNDSLSGIETLKDINRLQFQFETASKDKEILSQDLKIKEQENTILVEEKNSTRNMLLALVLFGVLVFSYFYYRQRQKLKNKEIESLKVNQELNKLESLIEGEEKERSRLAQDLHDGINGDLSVIKYKVTSIDKRKLNEEETNEFGVAISMLDNAIEQVRSISHDLAPPSLQNYNIVEALSEFCMKMSSGSNLTINFQNYGEIIDLPDESETAIYRIVQELLNNSIRHAEASKILVQVNFHEDDLHISVEDDGKGYNTGKIKRGLGLNNINSRAKFLGAEVNIDSSKNGTLTTLDINLKNKS